MELVFLLNMLCKLLFYFAWAFFLLPSPFEAYYGGYGVLTICAATAFLCYCLRRQKWLRFIPLTLLGLCFLSLYAITDLIMIVPVCIYIIYMTWKNKFHIGHGQFHSHFIRGCLLLVLLLFLAFLASSLFDITSIFILSLAYFICGITLLRLLRHKESTLSEPAFIVLNMIPGMVFVTVIFLVGSNAGISAISFIFFLLRMGIYYLLIAPMAWLGRGHDSAFDWTEPEPTGGPSGMLESDVISELESYRTFLPEIDPLISRIILVAILTVVLLPVGFTLFLLLKHLIRKFADNQESLGQLSLPQVEYEKFDIKNAGTWLPRFSRLSVARRYYRKFLKLCTGKGIAIQHSDTSAAIEQDVQKRFGDIDGLNQLRNVYIRERYHEEKLTKEDEAVVKNAFRRIVEVMVKK